MLDFFNGFDLILSKIANHFSSSNLNIYSFFDKTMGILFKEFYIDQRTIRADAFGIFFAGKIQNNRILNGIC